MESLNPSRLSALLDEGNALLTGIGRPTNAVYIHDRFRIWVENVSKELSPLPGLKAEWLGLPRSYLVTSGGYDASDRAWRAFTAAVSHRMDWIGKQIQNAETAKVKVDAAEPLAPLAFDKIIRSEKAHIELANRWEEAGRCFSVSGYLSAVILYGLILEGVLSEVLMEDPATDCRSTSAPKKDGKVKPFYEWGLADWINVAHENAFISDDAKKFNHVLREYRNMVHPREALRTGCEVDEHTCRICREIVHKSVKEVERKLSTVSA